MPNVTKLPGVFRSNEVQQVADFDYSDFCALLEADAADTVTNINGMTILGFPKCAIVCNGDRCTMIAAQGVSVDYLLREAHQLVEAPLAAANA